jgi:hypothetical protein
VEFGPNVTKDETYSKENHNRLGPEIELIAFEGGSVPCIHAGDSICSVLSPIKAGTGPSFGVIAMRTANSAIGIYASFDADHCRQMAAAFTRMAGHLDEEAGVKPN